MRQNLLVAYKKGYRAINGKIFYNNKEVKGKIGNTGYRLIGIRNFEGEKRDVYVHRLVAYQKYGKKIFKTGIQVRHLDGNKDNNKENNILIGTSKDNHNDKKPEVRMRVALFATGFIRKHNHTLIIKLHNQGKSYSEIMRITKIKSKGAISFIVKKSIQSKNK